MVDVAESYNVHAEEWALRLASGKNHAHSLLEKPAMAAAIPDLTGKKVLAIGCGSGEELALLMMKGAKEADIVGIDISSELIDTARASFPAATFKICAMEELWTMAPESFDFVYSSLTMHYAKDWQPILEQVRRILTSRGTMVFSTHHPVKWGSQVQRDASHDTFAMGYVRPKDGMPTVQGDYLGTRQIDDVWFGNMPVSYFHRPLSAIITDILASGLRITAFIEPAPIPKAAELAPSFYAIHSKIPLFMIFSVAKS